MAERRVAAKVVFPCKGAILNQERVFFVLCAKNLCQANKCNYELRVF